VTFKPKPASAFFPPSLELSSPPTCISFILALARPCVLPRTSCSPFPLAWTSHSLTSSSWKIVDLGLVISGHLVSLGNSQRPLSCRYEQLAGLLP
jgi:hypothetical protein